MRKLLPKVFSAILLVTTSLSTIAQNNISQTKTVSAIIVPCKSGELIIDGVSAGNINANDASRQTLSLGEHYVQLKSGETQDAQTISIDESFKSIIKIGCTQVISSVGIVLINKTLSLAGYLSSDTEDNLFGLDKGDELQISSAILNKKGNATLMISNAIDGNQIFKREAFNSLTNESVRIPSKGIYKIVLYTDALFGKSASLIVKRIPAAGSNPNFSTRVKKVKDTSGVEVMNTTCRVYSTTNLNHYNITPLTINLPKNTSYWAYWIGVGQEGKDQMKNFIEALTPAVRLISPNPVVLYGLKLIPALPAFNATASVNYKFMNTINAQSYIKGQAYSYYLFKHADNISADYALVNVNTSDLVLSLTNLSATVGHDVDVKVVAFVVRERMVVDE